MRPRLLLTAAIAILSTGAPASGAERAREPAEVLAGLDALFEKFMREQHVPGLAYVVVDEGGTVRLRALGVSDLGAGTAVTADTAFRIASMTKQFTALATLRLRDAGRLSLDAPAEKYVPELRRWRYPTRDSARITVRDLLSHGAGFVTDDPWADRQLDMGEEDFSRFVAAGVPFSRAPGMAYEYSNFGYALAGRVVGNVARFGYAAYISESILQPLGMRQTVWDYSQVPAQRRAIGYRWENERWSEEPVLGPGEFGAMGGLITTANDYARYVAWVLAAWPPRDDPEDTILRRASIREMARPANYAVARSPEDPSGCPRSLSYGYGVIPFSDCVLGTHFGHSGGLPGFGSNVLFIPQRGLAVFAFANRTYAPAARVVREAAETLVRSGAFPARSAPPGGALREISAAVLRIYDAADVLAASESLAENLLLDQSAALRNARIAELRQKFGACRLAPEPTSDSAMGATLAFECERGALKAKVLLAPTTPPSIQTLEFAP